MYCGPVPSYADSVPFERSGVVITRNSNVSCDNWLGTVATEAELAERIRFREAKTKALRDPAVQLHWKRSTQAETDFEKREALKSYYNVLFARIGKIDGTLTKLVALRQATALRALTQSRIDPTEPLDPDERAERFESP